MTTLRRTCVLAVVMSMPVSKVVFPQRVPLVDEAPRSAGASTSIHPFRVTISDATLVDLRRRIAATRWPERETVDDFSQGVQIGRLQPLVEYWETKYDWRKAEARLNALPNFVTNIGCSRWSIRSPIPPRTADARKTPSIS